MKRSAWAGLCVRGLVVFGVIGAMGVATAHGGLMASFTTDGETFEIPAVTENGTSVIEQYTQENEGEWRVVVSAVGVEDPSLVYAVSIVDFGSPSAFGFSFIEPIVPVSTPGVVSHSHSSSTTDGGGGDGTPVTATGPPAGIPTDGDPDAEIAVYSLSDDGGATYVNAGMDLSPSFVGAGPSDVQGPFSEGPMAGPLTAGSAYDVMRVDVNFSMAGNEDAFSLNGIAEVVPEPTAWVLALIAGVGFLSLRRRQLS